MDFNFDTGAIFGGLQSLDVSTLPPLGGQAGVLTLVGTGAITLLGGATGDRPATPVAGMFRYNSSNTALEYFDSTSWTQLSSTVGTVTSVAATGANGITVSGSPITSSGTIALGLGNITPTSVAATGTVTGSNISGTNTGDQTITLTGDVTGSGTGSFAATLATVNASPQTDAFVRVTVNGKGLVTATSPVSTSDITTLVDGTYVNISGDTMSSGANLTFVGGGQVLGLPNTPIGDSAAASKYYVDQIAAGLTWKAAVELLSVNDIAMTGATGTLSIDGHAALTSASSGYRILITTPSVTAGSFITGNTYTIASIGSTDFTLIGAASNTVGLVFTATGAGSGTGTASNAGIYVYTDNGATYTLTRSADADTYQELIGATVFVLEGTAYANTGWTQSNHYLTSFAGQTWVQNSGTGTYTGGTGITVSGNIISLQTPVTVANGGTGLSTTPTNGKLLIGNGTGYTLANITGGTGLSVTDGAGTISLANTGVTSIAGTANQISASASTGAVTLSVPSAFIAPGTVRVTTSLTVDTLTPNAALYATTGGQIVSTAALTDGQILVGSTGGAPVAATITAGTGISVTNAGGSITIATTAGSHVTSFSAGTTGLTPATATTGDVTLAGTLAVANGGTGLTTLGTANQVFGVNAGATAAEYKTLAAGTGMSVVHGANVVTFNNTGVTSVGLTAPSIFTVTGSPVTTTGTIDFALNTQAAHAVFVGPSTGTAVPTFRSLAYADLPIQLYVENPSTPTAPVASGANAVAIGSGSSATAVGSFAEGAGSSATIFGQKAFANGSFATAGDAQRGLYVARNITTDATLTELFLDGSAIQLVMPNNSVFTFDILVAARRTDATGGGAAYRFVGVARKDTTAGSVTFIGTPSKTVIGETNTAWDAALSVDTGTGAFRVRVTGEAAKTIRWVATIETTEVTN